MGWRQDAVLTFRGAYQVVFVIAEFCPTSEDLTPLAVSGSFLGRQRLYTAVYQLRKDKYAYYRCIILSTFNKF
jgi:hypothetical protein